METQFEPGTKSAKIAALLRGGATIDQIERKGYGRALTYNVRAKISNGHSTAQVEAPAAERTPSIIIARIELVHGMKCIGTMTVPLRDLTALLVALSDSSAVK